MFPVVTVPSFPHFCNVLVFPHPEENMESSFFLLKKTSAVPRDSNQKLTLEYLSGYIYCFLPSLHKHNGVVSLCKSRPTFLKDFSYCLEVDRQAISISGT